MLDAFLADAVVHYSIVEAIARSERTWSRITSRVGRDGGSLLRPVQWLQDMNKAAVHSDVAAFIRGRVAAWQP